MYELFVTTKKEFSKTLKILMNSRKDLMLNKSSLTVYLLNEKKILHKENMLYKKKGLRKTQTFLFISILL